MGSEYSVFMNIAIRFYVYTRVVQNKLISSIPNTVTIGKYE